MKAVILLPCLMATVFASPIRKVRDLGSNSHENYYRYYQQFYPNMYNRYMPFRPGYPMQPNYPYYPHMPMNPGYPGYYPNYLPNYNYPNYGYIPTYNGFARNSNRQLSKVKEDNNVGEGRLQQYSVISNTRPLSMSSEVSFEDSNSMEDTNFRIPFLDVPYGFPHYGIPGNPDFGVPGDPDFGVSENPDYGVPGDPDDEVPRVPDYGVPRFPDYGVPAVPDNEGPFTPGLDTNSAGVGFDQQNSQDPATEVFDTEEPTSVLPYSDYEQGMDSLGLNGEDDSMIGGSNEGLGQQNTIFNPFGLDVIFDQSWNNEEFSNQQTPNENLDEDDLTQEDETQNIGANTMDMNSMAFSQEEGNNDDGTESNLNVAVLNNNGPYTQEQDNAQSIEDDLNQMNVAGTNQQIDTQSTEDNLNQMNVAGTNQQIDTQSTEGDLNQINVAGSNVNNGSHFNQDENGAGVNVYDSSKTDNIQTELNSCKMVHCRHGRVCKLNEIGYPTCICQEPTSCPVSSPELQQVCGTNNQTYGSSCQFFASKCLLDGTKRGHNIHLDYIGPCKYIAPCLESELNEFPLRLRGWLKNILVEMYERDLYSPGLLSPKERTTVKKIYDHEHHLHPRDYSLDQLFNDFSQNYQMYIYPVHWQFSQLDRHPMDGYLSHTELAPLRTPLIPLEHCTSQFFGGCDLDGDKDISLREWSRCFGLKEEDINPNLVF